MLAIIKIISKSSAAWKAVFVYSCRSSLKFSPKDHGCPDPRTWRRASRAAAAGKMVELRQIRQNPEIVAKKIDLLSFSYLFSFFFRFFVFFSDCFFRFCFRFLLVFLVFESNLTKSKSCKCFSDFFLFFLRFFRFIPNYFRVPKTIFNLFSNYFRLKKKSLNYFRT